MSLLPITRAFLTHPVARPALKAKDLFTLRELRAIVIHWTANTDKGANAMANRNYFNLGSRPASAHYIVDDRKIVQCLPDMEVGYHCGDKPLGQYKAAGHGLCAGFKGLTPNYFTIGVEMCVNSDGNYETMWQNTVELVAYLARKYGLSGDEWLLRHYDVTGKKCPAPMLEPGLWAVFKNAVRVASMTSLCNSFTFCHRAFVTSKGLNLRSGPGVEHPVITELKHGEPVLIFETKDGWARVEADGWVNARYLARV